MKFGLSVESFKKLFFDRLPGEASKKTQDPLSKGGAYVRQVAKNLLKYRKDSAPPNAPPHVHQFFTRVRKNTQTGEVKRQNVSPLKELIYFGYDQQSQSVVVGPVLFKPSGKRKHHPLESTVPGTLERGGKVRIEEEVSTKAAGGHRVTRIRTTVRNYKPHPFMKYALTRSAVKLPEMFKGALIRKS